MKLREYRNNPKHLKKFYTKYMRKVDPSGEYPLIDVNDSGHYDIMSVDIGIEFYNDSIPMVRVGDLRYVLKNFKQLRWEIKKSDRSPELGVYLSDEKYNIFRRSTFMHDRLENYKNTSSDIEWFERNYTHQDEYPLAFVDLPGCFQLKGTNILIKLDMYEPPMYQIGNRSYLLKSFKQLSEVVKKEVAPIKYVKSQQKEFMKELALRFPSHMVKQEPEFSALSCDIRVGDEVVIRLYENPILANDISVGKYESADREDFTTWAQLYEKITPKG